MTPVSVAIKLACEVQLPHCVSPSSLSLPAMPASLADDCLGPLQRASEPRLRLEVPSGLVGATHLG
eukprot:536075-Hanusia_phi.AAC.1